MNSQTYKPDSAVSTRRIEQTPSDREEFNRQWKEDRDHKERLKNERFAAMKDRKKNKPGDSRGGKGINIEVS